MVRLDQNDVVYRTEEEKWRNAAKEIAERSKTGQPVLVGTISVARESEKLSAILKRMGVRHEVLNAKNHEREAFIVAQAGRFGAVTVSTNMAGRGTDILLAATPSFWPRKTCLKQKLVESLPAGETPLVADAKYYYFQRGEMNYRVQVEKYRPLYDKFKRNQCEAEHSQVVAAGGTSTLSAPNATNRAASTTSCAGRAGRQGDPGASRFFLSLQDDLLRIFGGERIQNLMLRLGMEEDVPIESKLITKRIAAAQKAVEAQNFASRKHVQGIRRRDEQAAQGRLWPAPPAARRHRHEGSDHSRLWTAFWPTFIDARCPEGQRTRTSGTSSDCRPTSTRSSACASTPLQVSDLSRGEIEEQMLDRLRRRYDDKEESRRRRGDARDRAHGSGCR